MIYNRDEADFIKAIEILRLATGKPVHDIPDEYFLNRKILSKEIDDIIPAYSQTFEIVIRWFTKFGKVCNKALVDYIIDTISTHHKWKNEILKKEGLNSPKSNTIPVIDFSKFTFIYKGKRYSLADFVRSLPTGQVSPSSDLGGADLSGLVIGHCQIVNCFFFRTNFRNTRFAFTQFVGCNFTSAVFDGCHIGSIHYDDKTRFGRVSLKNALVNAVDLKGFTDPQNIIEPSYFKLLECYFKTLALSRFKYYIFDSYDTHTSFLCAKTENNTSKKNLEFISYVDWYQSLTENFAKLKGMSFLNKIKFFVTLVATKYWRSSFVLVCFSVFVNLFYATIYRLIPKGFEKPIDFSDSIYFSVVTFTTLGFGDIKPIRDMAKYFIISEVMIGYTVLGIFVFLLSKKISKLF
ncbi:ion channel [Desulfoluna spongiiphila]|uniref:ion channel n=1 Tax=Desulfoluna spongiiphila TaxID=419481 RepID=UPI00186AB45C|nr:ion channel [Desulfoluna spongiiphila]